MEHTYVLPIAFAAAFHGALLFGFNKAPRLAAAHGVKTSVLPFMLSPEPEVVSAPASDRSQSTARAVTLDRPVLPQRPEPPAVVVERDFTFSPPAVKVAPGDLHRIIEAPTGLRDDDGNTPWSDGILSHDMLDTTPRARFQAAPIYPFEAKRQGVRGEVIVAFVVDESGAVMDPRVVSSTERLFEEASLRAVAKWKFEPGRRDGRLVRFRMVVPVVFNLNE